MTLRNSLIVSLLAAIAAPPHPALARQRIPDSGELRILTPDGKPAGACPLKHTDVVADIAGFVGRVTVRQTFYNPTNVKIEAVYVFPLPQGAAVDDMVMTVGDRRVVGRIKPRDEARKIYEAAKSAGYVASLLDQERPNIFTQSVANIEPGVEVVIEISYVETLKYDEGVFEWVFPMVVGPRYIPGGGSAPSPMTKGQDAPQVPDGSKITPPVTPKGTRAGHDISLQVSISGGTGPLPYDVRSYLHDIETESGQGTSVSVFLKNKAEISNRDFILHYRLSAENIGDAFLVHSDPRGTFFTLVLEPPKRVIPEQLMPRELIFVLDTSGSMHGFPIEKAKETMAKLIDTMRAGDTFNIITFAGNTRILWNAPRPNTRGNRDEAQQFLASRRGGGGTEMMKAINAALVQTRRPYADADSAPIRIVCFMTDGYVGNDMAIIDAVRNNADTTRVFSFGVGNSVNRFLLDGMAHAGRGEVEYVNLDHRRDAGATAGATTSSADAAVERFHERILAPVLTGIEIDWRDLPVADVYPTLIPDLFAAKPIMIHGRLTGPLSGTILLSGDTGAGRFEREIAVSTASQDESTTTAVDHPALASLWARAAVAELMNRDLAALQNGNFPESLKNEITNLGVEFCIMTQFTSFVAVEQMTVTSGGESVRIDVPVEMPDGVSYEGVFGEGQGGRGFALQKKARGRGIMRMRNTPRQAGAPQAQIQGRPATPAAGGAGFGAAPREKVELEMRDDEAGGRGRRQFTFADKLVGPLKGLAIKVEKAGRDGNLTVGKLRVIDYKLDVMIYLSDATPETLKALKELGFVETGRSKIIHLLIGAIDVRKLDALAKLKAVIRVRPVLAP